VRAGRCRLWAGHQRPASPVDGLPLVVCHGGPDVPSDYLFPLSGQLPRPVVFFDQLGFGLSERPSPAVEEYSIATSVHDLVEVVEALAAKGMIPMQQGQPAYHLYGQLPPRSLTLSNVPSSVPVLLEEVAALLAQLDGDAARFDATHVCRATPRPRSCWRPTPQVTRAAIGAVLT
jgi:pimeloyl-ACP methyl ester carboxylesterase